MPSLHDVERRIKSVKSTKQITSTMYMIAATKVGKSSARLEKSFPYRDAVYQMINSLETTDNSFPLLNKHEDTKTTLLIVVVSDKGLAGGFNSGILHYAEKYINNNKREGKQTKLIICGKKAHTYFEFRGLNAEMEFIGTSENPTFSQAEKIGAYCIDNYLSNNVDEVKILYNKCKNNLEQVQEELCVLPVEPLQSQEINNDFEYEPNQNEVLYGLVPTYIKTMIYNALLDSSAGEQIARRVAMQSATDNAEEMVETLTRLYNSVRQEAITTEINEIVGGADAAQN